MSVDYSTTVVDFDIVTFQSFQVAPLPISFGPPTDSGTQINSFQAFDFPPGPKGLVAGESYLLGTITFHSVTGAAGSFQIDSVIVGTDGLSDGNFVDITGTSTYNSSFVLTPEPGTLTLLGMGLGGLYVVGRRSRRKR